MVFNLSARFTKNEGEFIAVSVACNDYFEKLKYVFSVSLRLSKELRQYKYAVNGWLLVGLGY